MFVAHHGGNLQRLSLISGHPPEHILDFSASINPFGPPDWLRPLISRNLSALQHYPDPAATVCTEAAARRYGADPACVLTGNGSTELLHLLAGASGMQRVLLPVPAYSDYEQAASRACLPIAFWPLNPRSAFTLDWDALDNHLTPGTLLILGHPCNPTGLRADAPRLRQAAQRHPACRFLVDEAFGDFVEHFDSLTQARPDNVAVLLSLTKMFAVPGLRLGCAVATAAWSARAREHQMRWSVNTLAQVVTAAALDDRTFAERSRHRIATARSSLQKALGAFPSLAVVSGEANYLLIEMDRKGLDAGALATRLLNPFGIAIRVCENFRTLDRYWFRVAVRTQADNARLIEALEMVLPRGAKAVRPVVQSRTPAIMFQGTSSNAGKSVLTSALCRILLQDGLRVAPFKAQNMSLNSFVTRDGQEMGRAQVVQAQACRLEPDVRMNPVLLKPNSDTGSQVIVNGHPIGNMRVNTYIDYKPKALEAIQKAYDSLAAEYDAIVLEGAGSPGEVNLKAHDIVNMTMAHYAKAPVLLVGDIDRGGVFASFIGTMEVFTEAERARVAGFIVNRFRGQESLLQDAFDYTLRHTGKPVLGVVPYLHNLNLPEEDSVTFKESRGTPPRAHADQLEIAVIDLPHISNFTDLDALRIEPDVQLRIVRTPQEIGTPHALILPGSKNTLADLAWLKASGLAHAIDRLATSTDSDIIGICGGFQMLGRSIADPQHIETATGEADGLALLNLQTVMLLDKTLLRTTARHRLSMLDVIGYEIHHGQTTGEHLEPLLTGPEGNPLGFHSADGRIWGTYLHGLFDADPFRRWFLDRLRERHGLQPIGRIVAAYDIDAALDRLADTVRSTLDMNAVYRALGLP